MRTVFLLFGLMLLLGCAAEQPEQPAGEQPVAEPGEEPAEEPSEEPEEEMTCEEYCPTQPHIQCVGSWDISGTYPDCVCSFECDVEEEPEEEQEEPEDEATVSDKTLDEMIDDGIEKMKSDFYRKNSGSFAETTYTWKYKEGPEVQPGDLVFDTVPREDIKFDGAVITSLQAAAFVVFDEEDNGVRSSAMIVFLDQMTELDSYSASEGFDIEYFHSQDHGNMKDCWVTSKQLTKNTKGEWVSTYFISCERVFERD